MNASRVFQNGFSCWLLQDFNLILKSHPFIFAVYLFKWLLHVHFRVAAIESTFTRMVMFFTAECILLALITAVQLLVVRGWFGDSRQAGRV